MCFFSSFKEVFSHLTLHIQVSYSRKCCSTFHCVNIGERGKNEKSGSEVSNKSWMSKKKFRSDLLKEKFFKLLKFKLEYKNVGKVKFFVCQALKIKICLIFFATICKIYFQTSHKC